MSDIEWEDIEALYEAARARPVEEREAFLEEVCDDTAVRQEVASLLEARKEASGFFDDLADAVGASALHQSKPKASGDPHVADPLALEGEQVGGYAVEKHLGGGGMGVVYRAQDLQLDRPVALKFLPSHLASHPEAEERFVREAKAASVLDHPHIATIYEISQMGEDVAQGQRFIAMAYYEGETLKEKLSREGPFPVGEALRYAGQIAEALARAHEAGIVHRDVKPANVMITKRGEVKLLDFGLARVRGRSHLTDPGQRVGTAAYMSPEQAEGKEIGPRADLWALGILLYEMLAGERPFEDGRETAVLHRILHEEPTDLGEHRPEVSGRLKEVVDRCLQKAPAERYASAEDLLEDLRALRSEETSAAREGRAARDNRAPLGSHRWIGGAAAVTFIALGVTVSWMLWPSSGPRQITELSVAVLPFEVSGKGAETWKDGMVTMLSMNLDGAAGLRAISDRRIFAATPQVDSAKVQSGRRSALAIARQTGAEYAVLGSAVQLGGTLRLGAEIREVGSGKRLGRVEVQGASGTITTLTDRLTREILGVLLERSGEQVPSIDLSAITTESLEALKAYLRGERHFRRGDFEAAIEEYNDAVAEDSTFGLAHWRLARSHGWQLSQAAREQAHLHRNRAYELADQLPVRERRLLRADYLLRGRRPAAAVDTLQALTRAYPDEADAWYLLGEASLHFGVPPGWPAADRALGRAVALDFAFAPYHTHRVGLAFSVHRDSALVASRISAHPALDGSEPWFRLLRDWLFGDSVRREGPIAELDTAGGSVLGQLHNPLRLPPARSVLHERIVQERLERGGPSVNPASLVEVLILIAFYNRGQVRKALRYVERPEMSPTQRACQIAFAQSAGLPIPDSLRPDELASSNLNSGRSAQQVACIGVYATDRGREQTAERAAALLRKKSQEVQDATSETEPLAVPSDPERYRALLAGYRAWNDGRLKEATRHLSRASTYGLRQPTSLWMGDIRRELGDLERAKEWYLGMWHWSLAHERLGQLYEQMGNPEKATAAYERFVDAWNDADPVLQDRVEKARGRIQALRNEWDAE